MFFYIIILIISIILCMLNEKLNDKSKKTIDILTLVFFIIVSGTRYNLGGTDYYVYQNFFNSVPTLGKEFFNNEYIYEFGFAFLISIIKTIGLNFYGFTLIHSIIFYVCMYIGLKKYIRNFNFFIIIFLYKLFFYDTFISMRQSLAIAVFFISLKYIENRKFFKYMLCCSLAILFHSAAIVLIPIYFINRIKLTKNLFLIINVVCMIFLILNITGIFVFNPINYLTSIFSGNAVMLDKVEGYFNEDSGTQISILHLLEYYLITILVYFNYDRLIKINKNSEFIIKIFLILLPIFTIFRSFIIVTRIKDFFIFTYAALLYYLSNCYNKRYKIIIYICTIIICTYGFIRYIVLFDNGGLMPYESFIFKDISIFEKGD